MLSSLLFFYTHNIFSKIDIVQYIISSILIKNID